MRELLRRVRWLFQRERFDRELEEEMRHHLALKAEAAGDETAGVREFGNTTLLLEDSRAMWAFPFWEQLAQDVRYSFRTMAGNKLFTAMAIVSLALGIGANTAIFSFMHAILLRSLPVVHPEQLVAVNWTAKGNVGVIHGMNGSRYSDNGVSASPNFPFAAYQSLKQNQAVVSPMFAYVRAYEVNLVARNQAEVSRGLYVSGNFYSGLGVAATAGRLITEEDDQPGGDRVVVISYQYWQHRFATDPSAIGQAILINNTPFTVVGVSAPGFFGLGSSYEPAVFLPYTPCLCSR